MYAANTVITMANKLTETLHRQVNATLNKTKQYGIKNELALNKNKLNFSTKVRCRNLLLPEVETGHEKK